MKSIMCTQTKTYFTITGSILKYVFEDTIDGIVQKDKHTSKTSLCGFIHALLDVRDPNKSEDGENAPVFYGAFSICC